ncbi:MAG: hypothetical protein MI863_21305 [Desulfobacterales bacterium]|nr:hypothetical protein [Desulfobacterales bacterium]
MELHVNDILTRVTRYNLIRNGRMIYIDVHKKIQGKLAGDFIAVPNLVNIVAKPDHQGAGNSEETALADCLKKIKGLNLEDLFPAAVPPTGGAPAKEGKTEAPDSPDQG